MVSPTLTVYVAASLTDVIQEIGKNFEAGHGAKLVYNFAGSGSLAQQIMSAPRADVFISANVHWMDEVEKHGDVAEGTRKLLLHNALVVIANISSDYTMSGPLDLPGMDFKFFSVGDPGHVPAGSYTKKWLEGVTDADGKSVWSQIESRLSPAPDVRAALAQVESKSDIIGTVYRTDSMTAADKVKIIYQVPTEAVRIAYPVAALTSSTSPELARAFVDFLFTPKAQKLLSEAGFIVNSAG
ncbi:molybdate ABC transporter substrate-binding protein [Ruficoccus amylovorans]|uniref:Molybdate-binding protein ModA n=1 Tax=Ruficoccus amylovorans TaxID=1804625 RepID=A0A842H9L8_9BACT|nr:molybdate ABC transporter substrate-binding protein [Ruficoccus amylovorans]